MKRPEEYCFQSHQEVQSLQERIDHILLRKRKSMALEAKIINRGEMINLCQES